MRLFAALVLVFVAGIVPPGRAAELRCEIATKNACGETGCRPGNITVWNLIDLEARRYSRCDRKSCDHYPANISVSGLFYNIAVPERGMLAKLSQDGLIPHCPCEFDFSCGNTMILL